MTGSPQFGPDWQREFDAVISRFKGPGDSTTKGGTRLIRPIPRVAPLAHLLWLYAPIDHSDAENVRDEIGIEPPRPLLDFLSFSNGARLFENFSLRGCTGAQILRDGSQPISLRYGNIIEWVHNQPDTSIGLGSSTGYSSKSDYFLEPNGDVVLVTHDDYDSVAMRWPDFQTMLLDETKWYAQFYDDEGNADRASAERLRPELREWEAEEAARKKKERSLLSRMKRRVIGE